MQTPVANDRAHLAEIGPLFDERMVRSELLQLLGDDVKQSLNLDLLVQECGETILQTVTAWVRQAVRRRRGGCIELCGHGDGAGDDTASGKAGGLLYVENHGYTHDSLIEASRLVLRSYELRRPVAF